MGSSRRASPGRASSKASDRQVPLSPARQRFRRRLLGWYKRNGRDLPWRKTSDPYHILVSEVMLQQTQVDRVLPKYDEWLAEVPNARRARRGARSRRLADVAAAWLQHQAEAAPRDRARVGGALRRRAAFRRRDAALVQGHRRVHRRRGTELRFRPARRYPRHERRARAVPRVRRTRQPEGPRHAASSLGRVAHGASTRAASSTSTRRSWTSAPRSARRGSRNA